MALYWAGYRHIYKETIAIKSYYKYCHTFHSKAEPRKAGGQPAQAGGARERLAGKTTQNNMTEIWK